MIDFNDTSVNNFCFYSKKNSVYNIFQEIKMAAQDSIFIVFTLLITWFLTKYIKYYPPFWIFSNIVYLRNFSNKYESFFWCLIHPNWFEPFLFRKGTTKLKFFKCLIKNVFKPRYLWNHFIKPNEKKCHIVCHYLRKTNVYRSLRKTNGGRRTKFL